MTYFDDLPRGFEKVHVSEGEEIATTDFLEAAEGVVNLFDLFGSSAFSPVQSDMTGNIKKIRERQQALGEEKGSTLQKIVLSEVTEKKKTATQGLLWLTRGLQFTAVALRRNVDNSSEELSSSFTKAYGDTLSKYHTIMIRPVFRLAMKACPWRKDFYEKLGTPLSKVMEQLESWLAALEKIVHIIQTFLESGNYAKGL